jgi:hypothetical protein
MQQTVEIFDSGPRFARFFLQANIEEQLPTL